MSTSTCFAGLVGSANTVPVRARRARAVKSRIARAANTALGRAARVERLECRRLLAFSVVDFTQGANGDADHSPPLGDITWLNGILNPNNSEYFEGVSTLQRVFFDGIVATGGNNHTLTLEHDAIKGSAHAYDFLTSWDQALAATNAIAPGTLVDPDTDSTDAGTVIEAAEPGSSSPSGFTANVLALRSGANFLDIPIDDNMGSILGDSVAARVAAYEGFFGNRTLRVYGNAPITGGSMVFNGYVSGEAKYTLSWQSASTRILIEFAGHLAQGQDFTLTGVGYGAGKGAGSISGGPYHIQLEQQDGASTGSQDNQIQANAVAAPPDFTIDKTGDTLGKVTDPVDYTVTITNTGGSALTPTSITDSLAGTLAASSFTESGTNNDILDAGETWTLNYSRTVQAGDPDPLVNTVTAVFSFGSFTVTRSDSHTVNLFQPAITIDKGANTTVAAVGDTVTYTFTITNTSSADSPDLILDSLSDDVLGNLITNVPAAGTTLDPGESTTFNVNYTIKATDPDPLKNTVTVNSHPSGFPNVISDTDDHTVHRITPGIDIDKTGDAISKRGDNVTYTYKVTNTTTVGGGNAVPALENVTVVDDNATPGNTADDFSPTFVSGDTDGDGKLDATETWTYSATRTIPANASDPYVNIATATGKVVGSVATDSDTDSHSVDLFDPAISVTKTINPISADVGSTVTYTVTITNNTDTDLATPGIQQTAGGAPDLVPVSITDTLKRLGLPDEVNNLAASAFTESATNDNKMQLGETWTLSYSYTVQSKDFPSLENTVNALFNPQGFPNEVKGAAGASLLVTVPHVDGRMTGGGSIFTTSAANIGAGVRITHGFQLHCADNEEHPVETVNNRLEVNWGKPNQHFHLSHLTAVHCMDHPFIIQAPPDAPIDTLIGKGIGNYSGTFKGKKYNKAQAEITFIFIDAGEPGGPNGTAPHDTASYIIKVLNGPGAADDVVVLNTGDNNGVRDANDLLLANTGQHTLTFGNHQAHNELKNLLGSTATQIQRQIDSTLNALDNVSLTEDRILSLTAELNSLFAQLEAAIAAGV